jgi:hypothetical protein
MNFEFAEKINSHLEQLHINQALEIAEAELLQLPETEFHKVVGKNLLHEVDALAAWIEEFYIAASKTFKVERLYFEMNEFDINTDYWYIDGFAYSDELEFDDEAMDWLSDFDTSSQDELDTSFGLSGYEDIQKSFGVIDLMNDNNDFIAEGLQNARDWCEQIIIARFMELMRAAHVLAKQKNLQWAKLPIYFTEHEYDFIVKSI